jgi:hypothetical protein
MTPARENSTDYPKNTQLVVHTLEQATNVMEDGVEQMAWVIDFNGYTASNAPPFSVSMEVLNILSNHYPGKNFLLQDLRLERLGIGFLLNVPWVFRLFWRAISPFLNHVTTEKIIFVSSDQDRERFNNNFNMDEMEKRFGGSSDFE